MVGAPITNAKGGRRGRTYDPRFAIGVRRLCPVVARLGRLADRHLVGGLLGRLCHQLGARPCTTRELCKLRRKEVARLWRPRFAPSRADAVNRATRTVVSGTRLAAGQRLRAAIAFAGSLQPVVRIDQVRQQGLGRGRVPHRGATNVAPVCAIAPQ
eukprot:6711091-Prymnesium_polylepis.1